MEAFSLQKVVKKKKSCQDAWRSAGQLVRGQVNMVDEAKLCSPIRSTFEVLVVWCVVGCFMEKNRALSVDQCWLHALQFLVRLIYLLSILLGCNGFSRISCSRSDEQQTTKQWSSPFKVKVWLLEVLWSFLLAQPLSWSGCPIKCIFHCMAQLDRKMVHCSCIE